MQTNTYLRHFSAEASLIKDSLKQKDWITPSFDPSNIYTEYDSNSNKVQYWHLLKTPVLAMLYPGA